WLRARADAAMAQAGPARGHVCHKVDILGLPGTFVDRDDEGDIEGGTAALRPGPFSEAGAMDVQTLGVLRRDEAVVLALVEPEHFASHRAHLLLERAAARALKTRARIDER